MLFNQSPKKKTYRFDRKGHKQSAHETQEFGPGKIDVILCPSCSAVYYYKSWHHNMLHYSELTTDKRVAFSLCPACLMWKRHQWEGEIRIAGIPREYEEQIRNTILAVADEAYRRDPMDRVFDIKSNGGTWIVYTSENQLAQRIARKLQSSLKKHFTKPNIRYGKKEDAVLIKMEWMK